jgi:hypothetical protein
MKVVKDSTIKDRMQINKDKWMKDNLMEWGQYNTKVDSTNKISDIVYQ